MSKKQLTASIVDKKEKLRKANHTFWPLFPILMSPIKLQFFVNQASIFINFIISFFLTKKKKPTFVTLTLLLIDASAF